MILVCTQLAAAMACKCWQGNNIDFGASRNCCAQSGGTWTGDDCAFAPGGDLGKFNPCCGSQGNVTDC